MSKTKQHRKTLICALFLTLATITTAAQTTQKNAANLYRKAIKLYQPDQKSHNSIYDLLSGGNKDYQAVIEHIKLNRKALDIALEASKIENCDWNFKLAAYDPADPNEFTKEFGRQSGNHAAMKQLVKLILADAKVHAHKTEIKKATDEIIDAYSMTRHNYSDSVIGWLVMKSMESKVNQLLHEILSEHRLNASMLNYIERHLSNHMKLRQTLIKTFDFETRYYLETLSKATLESTKESIIFGDPNIIDEIIKSDDAAYAVFDRDYFLRHQQKLRTAFSKPYAKAIVVFGELDEVLSDDAVEFAQSNHKTSANYTAFMMKMMSSSSLWSYFYSSHISTKTRFNALLTAVEIYLVKAKTGKLPAKIPAGLAKDLFSGNDFAYEKTDTGFILRCQAKDLSKDKIYEYEFKVVK